MMTNYDSRAMQAHREIRAYQREMAARRARIRRAMRCVLWSSIVTGSLLVTVAVGAFLGAAIALSRG